MPPSRGTQAPPGPSRDNLLASAIECFNRKGYAATTVREIVEAAGVTKPVLYYYFGNKEGLYLEIVRGSFERFQATLDEARRETGPIVGRMLALCDRVYALVESNMAAMRLMTAIYYGPPQGAPHFDFDVFHFRFQEDLRDLIQEGLRTGEIRPRPVDHVMWALVGALNIALEVELCHPEMALERKGLRHVLEAILEGVGNVPARSTGKSLRVVKKRPARTDTKGKQNPLRES